MAPSETSLAAVEAFIARWDGKGQAERANCQPFLSELCDLLGLPRPDPAEGGAGDYRFERSVTRQEDDGSTSTRRIDLYRRARFVLEAKQGAAKGASPRCSRCTTRPRSAPTSATRRAGSGTCWPPRARRRATRATCRRRRAGRRS